MSQNICLICCYSFQEKRSRFISDEAKESFRKFSNELGFPLSSGNSSKDCGSLNLPFGECITVCGDCLSLVVVYVQRRSVLSEKEAHLIQLQKAVCKAIKELSSVVEDVQSHINRLHGTIRMGGEESTLDTFMKSQPRSKRSEHDAKAFRQKVLALHTTSVSKFSQKDARGSSEEPSIIKMEPVGADVNDDSNFSENENDNASFADGDFDESMPEAGQYLSDANDNCSSNDNSPEEPSLKRSPRKMKKRNYNETYREEGFEDVPDPCFDVSDADAEAEGESDNSETEKSKRRKRGRPKYQRGPEFLTRHYKYGNILSAESAAKWKDELFSRVMEHLNKNIIDDLVNVNDDVQAKTEQSGADQVDDESEHKPRNDNFHVVNGHLQIRGIVARVHENRRMLECMRCYKMYFEERDIAGKDTHVETLMKNHILEKHFVTKKVKILEEIDVMEYTSHTKTKITFKLACDKRYSYTRRCCKKGGPSYFRCDFRKENCSASIVFKDGKYMRLQKGWNANGYHAVHLPNVDRTNRQIAVGNAKHMYLTDQSKTIDEVCDIIMNQSSEQPLPLSKLKRAMVYSKYGSRGMAPEEKVSQTVQCCYCGKIYKENRGLSRHMRTQHEEFKTEHNSPKEEETSQPTSSALAHSKHVRLFPRRPSPVRNKAKVQKRVQKSQSPKQKPVPPPEQKQESISPESSSAPSIVFNDPSAANNFVTRCISAIMQQVGVSASSNASSNATNRSSLAAAPTQKDCSNQSPTSPAASESSLAESMSQSQDTGHQTVRATAHSSSSSFGIQSNHWNHAQNSSGQQVVSGQYGPQGSNQTPVWQWGLH